MFDLTQGDCLELMKNIPNKSVDMILCDLPYNMTACRWDCAIDLDKLFVEYNRIIKENGNIVLFSKQPFTTELINANRKHFRYEIIWQKQQATNPMCAKKRIMPIHENILVFYKRLGTYNPQMSYGSKNYNSFESNKQGSEVYKHKSRHRDCKDGSRYPTSVIKFNTERTKLHDTQKPVALLEYLIKTYTNENELVLDNCMGSGSTGVACINTNRRFIGIELETKYFEIAEKRIKEAQDVKN